MRVIDTSLSDLPRLWARLFSRKTLLTQKKS